MTTYGEPSSSAPPSSRCAIFGWSRSARIWRSRRNRWCIVAPANCPRTTLIATMSKRVVGARGQVHDTHAAVPELAFDHVLGRYGGRTRRSSRWRRARRARRSLACAGVSMNDSADSCAASHDVTSSEMPGSVSRTRARRRRRSSAESCNTSCSTCSTRCLRSGVMDGEESARTVRSCARGWLVGVPRTHSNGPQDGAESLPRPCTRRRGSATAPTGTPARATTVATAARLCAATPWSAGTPGHLRAG